MAGKNKIERGFRFLWDDSGGTPRDLSGDLIPGSIQNAGGIMLDEVDMTGVSEAIKTALGGHGTSAISARFHMNDTASTGAFTVLAGTVNVQGTLTLQYGSSGAAPTTGDPEWEGEYLFLGFNVVSDGGRMVLEGQWRPAPGSSPAWGTFA